MTWAAWLMALAVPLAVRVVVGLGFSVVTFTGVTELVAQLVALAQANWSALPATILQLAALSGIPESLGITMAAFSANAAMWVIVHATRWVVKAPA